MHSWSHHFVFVCFHVSYFFLACQKVQPRYACWLLSWWIFSSLHGKSWVGLIHIFLHPTVTKSTITPTNNPLSPTDTLPSPYWHPINTLLTPYWHPTITLLTPYHHPTDIPSTPYWHTTITLLTPYHHPTDIPSTPYWHPTITLLTPYHHPTDTLPSPYWHPTITLLTPYHHPTDTLPSPYWHPTITLLTPYHHPTDILSTPYRHTTITYKNIFPIKTNHISWWSTRYHLPPFDFSVDGVTSISADTHKVGSWEG